MYLITGATGNIGSEVVRALRAADEPVAALVRGASARRPMFPHGVEIRHGDLTAPTGLRAVWDGIDAVFLLPGYDATPAILRHAAAAGVTRVVLLSGVSAASRDMTNAITAYMTRSEDAVRESGLATTILRPAAFMSNALRWRDKLHDDAVVRLPFAGVRTACIDPRDLAAVAATALRDPGYAGQVLLPTGPEALSPADQVEILGEVLGRPLTFAAQPDDEARAEMLETTPAPYVDAFFDFYVAGALDESQVTTVVADVTGRAPSTFRGVGAPPRGRVLRPGGNAVASMPLRDVDRSV
ncbi:MAG: NAD(P)H-binding protein [Gordonia sp. (in: high G+C Gram-positive bacteria)]